MQTVQIPLSQLRAHPLNSNVMPEELLEKLASHIGRSGRYPPLIVRRSPEESGAYQVLDGHHRWKALARLGHEAAWCMVWEADDAQASALLATLNRLQGHDDPRKRAELICDLRRRLGAATSDLARILPENSESIGKLLEVAREPLPPRPPLDLEQMPTAIHFFLSGQERKEVEAALVAIDASRERALMTLVRQRR